MTCSKCGMEKPEDQFEVHRRQCRACMASGRTARSKAWRKANPERALAQIQAASFKLLYGITRDAAIDMWEKQGRACAICRVPVTWDGKQRHVDHDHATGKVRGILCRDCNRILSHLERVRPPDWVARAIAYLGR